MTAKEVWGELQSALTRTDNVRIVGMVVALAGPIIITILGFWLPDADPHKDQVMYWMLLLAALSVIGAVQLGALSPMRFYRSALALVAERELHGETRERLAALEKTRVALIDLVGRSRRIAQAGTGRPVDQILEELLKPLENDLDALFSFEGDDLSSFTVFGMTKEEQLRPKYLGGKVKLNDRAQRTFEKGKGFVGKSVRLKKSILTPDLSADPEHEDVEQPQDEALYRSIVASPVLGGGDEEESGASVIGVVCVTSNRLGQFSRDTAEDASRHKRTAKMIAACVAVACPGLHER